MFFFSPLLTFIVLGICGLIVVWLIFMLPTIRRATGAVIEAESQRGAFLYQTLHGMRTVKSLALETRQRHEWDVQSRKSPSSDPAGLAVAGDPGRRSATGEARGHRHVCGRRLSGADNQRSRLHRRPVRLPDAVAARRRPADADGAARQPV